MMLQPERQHMPLYQYVKTYPKPPVKKPVVLPFVFMATGMILLLWATWPILSFKLFAQALFARTVSPLQENIGNISSVLPAVVLAANSGQQDSGQTPDYTNPNVWYPMRPQRQVLTPVNTYKLSVSKLKIQDAMVVVGGDSLEKSLIHYGGTPMPGEFGNTVIFGHSTLPQLYDPKNYKTIFSTLPTLKIDDEIIIDFDGMSYKYKVINMYVTKPDDLSPLEQRFDDSYITLITCVPPGTYWERLNVLAKLSPL
jgi:sortase A